MMRVLTEREVYWISRRLPEALWWRMVEHRQSMCVAGGFIRSCIASEEVNDIDVFTATKEQARLIALEMSVKPGHRMVSTDNAYTVLGAGVPIQFIHRWSFETPLDAVKSFDFTIASAAVWIGDELDHSRHHVLSSTCDDDFYSDLAAKRLVYRAPIRNEDAGGSLLRLLKFYQRGYRAPLESTAAVMARMAAAVDPGKLISLQQAENLTAEQAIAKVFTGMLREVDPLIDPYHFTH